MTYARIYKNYLNWMPRLDQNFWRRSKPTETGTKDVESHHGTSFKECDELATQLGKEYRGLGLLVGILGVFIVFSAVTPAGLHIEDIRWLIALGLLKVGMMLYMLYLVLEIGGKSGLKTRWIAARLDAERLRYFDLDSLTQALRLNADQATADKLRQELESILGSQGNGQISYNRGKASNYMAIERASEFLSWAGFAAALICAIWLVVSEVGLVEHRSWLIFGTAAIPALVGGIHGLNGFLNISGLAEEHEKMANFLEGIHDELNATPSIEFAAILSIAERALAQLVDRDVQWEESIKKCKISLA